MIKINLTGANANNRELALSIGGLVANAPFKNGTIFSNLSKYDKQKGSKEIRVLSLTNKFNIPIKSISIYYEIQNNNGNFDIDIGGQFFDEEGTVELLDSDSQTPLYVTFVTALGLENAVQIDQELQPEESMAIWLRRIAQPMEDDCEIVQYEGRNSVIFYISVEL
jgi:hypothetical protein